MPTGRATPWPSRAETAVRLFKRQYEKLLMDASVHPTLNKVTHQECWGDWEYSHSPPSGYTLLGLLEEDGQITQILS